ncbi:MAG: FAD-dependent oxidoreductase [Pyrinomonadaceae bacterium]
MIPKTSDGRVLFAIPWHGHLVVGTTDTPSDKADLEPKALEAEIDFILETVGSYLSKAPKRGDVLSIFVGIRPLIKAENVKKTSTLSREHFIGIDEAGVCLPSPAENGRLIAKWLKTRLIGQSHRQIWRIGYRQRLI